MVMPASPMQGWPVLETGATQAYCHFLPFATNLIIRELVLTCISHRNQLTNSYPGAAEETHREGPPFMQKA